MFQATEADPLGAWIATRNNIQVSEFRTAGDIWKWYETSESLTPMKLRALGISDAFLSGDASYASSESAYSTFVETVDSYRTHLTNKIFYNKIFPLKSPFASKFTHYYISIFLNCQFWVFLSLS